MQNRTLHNFTLLHHLGTGGMAEVWYAENSIGKSAAIKIMLPKFIGDKQVVTRFENEAKAMVQLNHPNIRQVYDMGIIDERPFIIMEYLKGEDLSQWIKQNKKPTEEQLQHWWKQCEEALHYTHQKNIIHRDIKPSNLFITSDGNIKILDFGIAKVKQEISLTITGLGLGTLLYMSPSQIVDPKRVKSDTDFYSLAISFIHLVSGRTPYAETESEFNLQLKIVNKEIDIVSVPLHWKERLLSHIDISDTSKHKVPVNNNDHEKTIVETKNASIEEIKVKTDEINLQFASPKESITNQPKPSIKDDYGIEFIWVEGGTFEMGIDDEKHHVRLDGYYMAKFPITQGQWQKVMGDNPSCFKGNGLNCPVEMVSWKDCQEFIKKINQELKTNYRLPTEAEWEFAARGGVLSKGFRFAGSDKLDEIAWFEENRVITEIESSYIGLFKENVIKYLGTCPIGSKKPNELGIYDMSGNVFEWCEDWYREYTKDSKYNPKGPEKGTYKIMRGGSWRRDSFLCLNNSRHFNSPTRCNTEDVGFRLIFD